MKGKDSHENECFKIKDDSRRRDYPRGHYVLLVIIMIACSCATVFAAGDVSSAIESTWNDAKSQIQNVVNNVVFPVLDMILAILFFVKIGSAYFDYRKHGQFEFTAPAILFACLIFTITAPLYIWSVI